MPFNYNIPKKGTPLIKQTNNKKKTGKTLLVPPKADDFEELAKRSIKVPPPPPTGEDKFDQLAANVVKPVFSVATCSMAGPSPSGSGGELLPYSEINHPPKRPSQLQVQTRATANASRSQVVSSQQSLITTGPKKGNQLQAVAGPRIDMTIQNYRQLSSLVEDYLIKRQSLEPIQSSFQGKRDILALFYVKMTLSADKVTSNRDFTMFTYNSGITGVRCRTEELLTLFEGVNDQTALYDLREAIYGKSVENSIKIAILPILIQKQVKIERSCIDIDENLFEMMYHKIAQAACQTEHTSEALQLLCEELDLMLFNIYSENYNESTAKIIDNIGNQVAFPNPIYKRQGSVNYLSTSSAETKYYQDYIVVVFATFLLLDCTEFIAIHLAMERNIKLINTVIRELTNKNISLILKRIDPDFINIIYSKVVELLFYKGWAEYSQISQIIHDVIFCNDDVGKSSKSIFYSEAVKRIYTIPKYRDNLHDAFYMLTKSVDQQLLINVKNRLSNHPVYNLFDQMIVKQLENTRSHNRQNIFICMLIREETIPLLEASTKVNLDPDDANSVVNLIGISQTLSRQNTLTITGGKIRPMITNKVSSNIDTGDRSLVAYNQSTNTTIYRISK